MTYFTDLYWVPKAEGKSNTFTFLSPLQMLTLTNILNGYGAGKSQSFKLNWANCTAQSINMFCSSSNITAKTRINSMPISISLTFSSVSSPVLTSGPANTSKTKYPVHVCFRLAEVFFNGHRRSIWTVMRLKYVGYCYRTWQKWSCFSRKFQDFRNLLFFMIPFPVLCFLVS